MRLLDMNYINVSSFLHFFLIIICTCLGVIFFFRVKFFALRRKHHSIINSSSEDNNNANDEKTNNNSTNTSKRHDKKSIGFYHPHCSAGGGGERVLWKAIESLGELYLEGTLKDISKLVIYTLDAQNSQYHQETLRHVKERFSINITPSLPLTFIHLSPLPASSTSTTRKFTLIAESIDSIKLAYQALHLHTPTIYIDTTGCAFTYLVAKVLAACKVIAYVHYPTISTDMLQLVWQRRPSYNNQSQISQSTFYSIAKLIYYSIFAIAYGITGSLADLVMTNSTWTYNHIIKLWTFSFHKNKNRMKIVYPPCDTAGFQSMQHLKQRNYMILSIGQFRPEKDHELQIKSFAKLLSNYPDLKQKLGKREEKLQLVLIGSCRNSNDEQLVSRLQKLVDSLDLNPFVQFVINQPFDSIKTYFQKSSIGIHTMWNEHFGIGIVEMMAAGLITVAHNSGGPKSDIIKENETGYLASTKEEYANALYKILNLQLLNSEEGQNEDHNGFFVHQMRIKASEYSNNFSDQVFMDSFKEHILDIY
mmetsp:Transcript_30798/g.35410  ORF Transcript_30798/g.35410 Transcript_30798/m.35410 type:complete len:533 (-) Transcript_30798:52-1650(-)